MNNLLAKPKFPQSNRFLSLPNFFDDFFSDIEYFSSEIHYPPHNIVSIGNGEEIKIEVATAGFSKEELDISLTDNLLLITGRKVKEASEGDEYRYQGISNKNFDLKFRISNPAEVKVNSATYNDGILTLMLSILDPKKGQIKKIQIE
jgi:molecular chaperone IbpA